MDPCPFVRLVVGSLGLKFSGGGAGNPPPPSCYCKIKLKNFTTQIADIAYSADSDVNQVSDQVQACFNFKKSEFDRMVEKSNGLKIEVYSGRKGNPICGVGSGKLIGVVLVGLDSKVVDGGSNNWGRVVVQNGWVRVGDGSSKKSVQLHLNVRVEPDPRFVFEFDGEPECSPQVFQVNGNVRQAVFTCKFSFRNSGDRNLRSGRSHPMSPLDLPSRCLLSICPIDLPSRCLLSICPLDVRLAETPLDLPSPPSSRTALHIVSSAKKLSSRTGKFDSKNKRGSTSTRDDESSSEFNDGAIGTVDRTEVENFDGYVLPDLPGMEPDFWEGPQWDAFGFFIEYLWAFGIVFAKFKRTYLVTVHISPGLVSLAESHCFHLQLRER